MNHHPRLRIFASIVAVLMVALAAASTAVPASADSYRHLDRVKDVTYYNDIEGTYQIQKKVKKVDITHLRVAYTERKVLVSMRLRDLTKEKGQYWIQGRLVTGDGKEFWYRFGWKGSATHTDSKSLVGDDGEAKCRRLTEEHNYAKDTVRVRIPAQCLGRPDALRTGVVMRWDAPDDESSYRWLDDGHRKGVNQKTFLEKLGPNLSRG